MAYYCSLRNGLLCIVASDLGAFACSWFENHAALLLLILLLCTQAIAAALAATFAVCHRD